MKIKGFSDYFFHNLLIDEPNQVQISSTCNARCIFCSNEQNPFKIQRCGFRDVEEIEKILWTKRIVNGPIMLGESLPGIISEGEALLHPEIFKILSLITKRFHNPIQISTNGILLKESFVKKLASYNPLIMRISFHSTNEDNWCKIFGLKRKDFLIAKEAFSLLKKYKIKTELAIVPVPSLVGYDDIESVFDFFSSKFEKGNVIVYSPGYTKYTKKEVLDRLRYDKKEMSSFIKKMRKKYSTKINWSSDPVEKLNVSPDFLKSVFKNLKANKIESVIFFTSLAAQERMKKLIGEVVGGEKIKINVIAVENKAYGGNIECAGLLMVNDIKLKVKELNLSNENIVVPDTFLDKYGYDLQGENIIDFIKKNNNKFFVVNTKSRSGNLNSSPFYCY